MAAENRGWSRARGVDIRERALKLEFFYLGAIGPPDDRVACCHPFPFRSRRELADATGLTDAKLKGSEKFPDRLSVATESVLGKLLCFDPDWPEWRNGTAYAFAKRYNLDNWFKKEVTQWRGPFVKAGEDNRLGHCGPSPPRFPNVLVRRVQPARAIDPILASVTLFADQADVARLSVEITGTAATITVSDEHDRPLLQREIVVLRCQVELQLDGAEVVGGARMLTDIVAAFQERDEAQHVEIVAAGSAFAPRLRITVKEGCLGVLRPGYSPLDEDGGSGALCELTNLQEGAEVIVALRVYSKDFCADPQEATASIAVDGDGDGEHSPIGGSGGAELSDRARVLIMKRLWEKSQQLDHSETEPGSIVVAFDELKFEFKK